MINKTHITLKKNKHLFYSVAIALFTIISTYAQQTPHYTQYLYNMQTLNPAYAGYRSDLSITALSRNQWVGVEGAPTTKTFAVNARTFRGLGLGLTVINDQLGLAESTNITLDASYTIITSINGRLALGLKGGITSYNNNLAEGITPDNDSYASISGKNPNTGFGVLYYTKKYYAGFSVPNILKSDIFKTSQSSNIQRNISSTNYIFTAGAIFELNEEFKIKPSTIIQYTPNLPNTIDLNANLMYQNKVETGLSYRYNSSISALFAVVLKKKLRIGYAYDYQLANLGNNVSSHEILLHIDLNTNRNTRWLLENTCCF